MNNGISEKESGIYMRQILSVFAHVAWVVVFALLFTTENLDHSIEGLLNQLIGALTAIILMIYGFYFSSSNGSKMNDELKQERDVKRIEATNPDIVVGTDEVHADSPVTYDDRVSKIEQGVYNHD